MGETYGQLQSNRQAFWEALALGAPELDFDMGLGWEKQISMRPVDGLKLVLSLSQDRTSVYLVARTEFAKKWMSAHLEQLARRLRTVPGEAQREASAGRWFIKEFEARYALRHEWPEMILWLRAQHITYKLAITGISMQ